MKKTILVDIDIIIEYLKTGKGMLPKAYDEYTMMITPVTYTELLASKTFQDEKLETEVDEFIKKYFSVTDITEAAGVEAAKIIRDKGTNLATALVAGVSKANSMPILTNEKAAFEDLEGVELVEMTM